MNLLMPLKSKKVIPEIPLKPPLTMEVFCLRSFTAIDLPYIFSYFT
ncbi:MAG: hypothetical protein K0S39_4616 [Paenibacillus sp.]|nr:hypothetical protein [Paenibacillus sp.]